MPARGRQVIYGLSPSILVLGIGFGPHLAFAVLAVAVAVAWYFTRPSWAHDRRSAVLARCDAQHGLVMAGDDRGVFGEYPPALRIERR